MKNISTIYDCYGCGVCALSCPKKIIEIKENKDGFYSPVVKKNSECISCGICIDVCSFLKNTPCQTSDPLINVYAARSFDDYILKMSSSGGISFEIGKYGLKNNYKICACTYDTEKNIAKHIICENKSKLEQTFGSKYIPSYTYDAFANLNRTDKFIVIGTPCQIDSLRRWSQKFKCEQNYIFIDLFCHGVPSILMYKKYYECVKKRIGEIKHVYFRNKDYGWHKSCHTKIKGENCEYLDNPFNPIKGIFFSAFLSDFILSKSCYKCKYKHTHSAADIRIGDYWGDKYKDNEEGTNLVYVFTEKGQRTINAIRDNIYISEENFGAGLKNQPSKPPPFPLLYNFILQLYRLPIPIHQINFFSHFIVNTSDLKR